MIKDKSTCPFYEGTRVTEPTMHSSPELLMVVFF